MVALSWQRSPHETERLGLVTPLFSLSHRSDTMAEISTRPLYKETLNLFARLVRLLENPEALASIVSESLDTSAIGPTIRDDCGRFKVWAENVGAHRGDRLSLDHRLREATRMKHMVVSLLEDLITALRDGLLLHHRLPCEADSH
jgi:hypothetical protein